MTVRTPTAQRGFPRATGVLGGRERQGTCFSGRPDSHGAGRTLSRRRPEWGQGREDWSRCGAFLEGAALDARPHGDSAWPPVAPGSRRRTVRTLQGATGRCPTQSSFKDGSCP